MTSARMMMGLGFAAMVSVLSLSASSDAAPGQARADRAGSVTKDGDHYHVEVAATGCKVNAQCPVSVKITGKGGFHVNTEFPTAFKVTGDAAELVSAEKNVTEASGNITAQVKVKSGSAIAGTVKFAVCSNDKKQCEPNSVDVSVGL